MNFQSPIHELPSNNRLFGSFPNRLFPRRLLPNDQIVKQSIVKSEGANFETIPTQMHEHNNLAIFKTESIEYNEMKTKTSNEAAT